MYSSSLINPFLPEPVISEENLPKGISIRLFNDLLVQKDKPLLVIELSEIGRVARVERVNTLHGEAIQIASFAIATPKNGLISFGQDNILGNFIIPLWRVLAFEGKGSNGDHFISSRVLYPDLDPPNTNRLLDLAARIESKLRGVHITTKRDQDSVKNLAAATNDALRLASIHGSRPYAPLPTISY